MCWSRRRGEDATPASLTTREVRVGLVLSNWAEREREGEKEPPPSVYPRKSKPFFFCHFLFFWPRRDDAVVVALDQTYTSHEIMQRPSGFCFRLALRLPTCTRRRRRFACQLAWPMPEMERCEICVCVCGAPPTAATKSNIKTSRFYLEK